MKSFVLAIVSASLLGGVVEAKTPGSIHIYTDGPDYHADGTPVKAGDLYALVWSAKGKPFEFFADGQMLNSEYGELLFVAQTQADSCCSSYSLDVLPMPMFFPYQFEDMDKYNDGDFELYLLDTRYFDKNPTEATGSQGCFVPWMIDTYRCVARVSVADAKKTPNSEPIKLEKVTTDISFVPKEAPQPLITACRMVEKDNPVTGQKERFFEVAVKRTVRYLNYNLAQGTTPNVPDQGGCAVTPVPGSYTDNFDEEIKVLVPVKGNEKCGFFKVMRQGVAKPETEGQ